MTANQLSDRIEQLLIQDEFETRRSRIGTLYVRKLGAGLENWKVVSTQNVIEGDLNAPRS